MAWKINNKTDQYRLVAKFTRPDDRSTFLTAVVDQAGTLSQDNLQINCQARSVGLAVPRQASQPFRDAIDSYLKQSAVTVEGNKSEAGRADSSDGDYLDLYCDGGSRGNPGPAASGYIIINQAGHPICQGGDFLGVVTNNRAEYESLKKGLTRAVGMGIKALRAHMDSQLVVRQVQGQYRVKHPELKILHQSVIELAAQLDDFQISHVPRELNKTADAIVNQVLDNHSPETKPRRSDSAAVSRSKSDSSRSAGQSLLKSK